RKIQETMSRDRKPLCIRAKWRGQSGPVEVSFDSDANRRKGARMQAGRFCKVARQSRTFGALRALRGRLRSSRYLFGKGVVEHKESIRFLVFSFGCLSRVSALALSQFAVLSFVSDSQLGRVYAP